MDENEVIEALCHRLEAEGCEIEQRLHTSEKGVDVIARLSTGKALHVEAKGATSSRKGSPAHGRPFDSSATRINVAEAFYTASSVAGRDDPDVIPAVAFHDDALHRKYVEPLVPACNTLGIQVFWVGDRPTSKEPTRRRTPDELRRHSTALIYELQMLYLLNGELQTPPTRAFITNACVESFAIHARSMIAFLWGEPTGDKKPRHKDDVWAVDYFAPGKWAAIRRPAESTLNDVRRRASKEIAHLSLSRTDDPASRLWEHEHIAASLGRAFQLFLENVDPEVLVEGFEQNLRSVWPRELNFPVALSWPPTTNPIVNATTSLLRPEDELRP